MRKKITRKRVVKRSRARKRPAPITLYKVTKRYLKQGGYGCTDGVDTFGRLAPLGAVATLENMAKFKAYPGLYGVHSALTSNSSRLRVLIHNAIAAAHTMGDFDRGQRWDAIATFVACLPEGAMYEGPGLRRVKVKAY